MVNLGIFKSKIFNFIVQIVFLSLIIYLFEYKFKIYLDNSISKERKEIIQFIANYIFFKLNDSYGMYFIYIIWTFVSLVPIINFKDYKKAYSMNFTTFFFPNFFFYIFLYRYSPNFFNLNFLTLFTQTVILGCYILIFSLISTFLLIKVTKPNEEALIEDLKKIELKTKMICPQCGTNFNSIPKYCYNCLKELQEVNVIN